LILPILTPDQLAIAQLPLRGSCFLEGLPGSGKTTAAQGRLLSLIEAGVPADNILLLVPQRTLATPYYELLSQPNLPAGGLASILTLGGLAKRTIQLFWPLIASEAGFLHPEKPPTFLTLETAQYFIAQVVRPLLDVGYFEQLVIDRNRLFSQILDNLNKAAVVGFSHTSIAERLKQAWIGQPSQIIAYDQAQECANLFRDYCLANNLLDFSIQVEIFNRYLWSSYFVREYLSATYRHLIYENVEEDVPAVHDLVLEWLPDFESALFIYDQGGGNRTFLGADPDYAYRLHGSCDYQIEWDHSFVTTEEIRSFQVVLEKGIKRQLLDSPPLAIRQAFSHIGVRFFTEMVEQVCNKIILLVEQDHVAPDEIAILSPYLSDALRHTIMNRLQERNIPVRSLRPSRSLRSEPTTRCLLTLARLAHPQWGFQVTKDEVRVMLLQVISGLDLVRADLMVDILYRPRHADGPLIDFDPINAEMQERITFTFGDGYTRLRGWLTDYLQQPEAELDVFLARLFGELLSQPGFGFHDNFDAAGITANLIESVQKFRRVAEPALQASETQTGKEYIQMLSEGVIAAQYLQPYQEQSEAVLLAPAHTFIMANKPVSFQFWLDAGSLGWWERLFQPLTHPHVLSRRWQPDAPWTDADEYNANQEALTRLVRGLLLRCRQKVFLCSVRVNERGAEERGPLLQTLQTILRRLHNLEGNHV
jgi:hypothetical protein